MRFQPAKVNVSEIDMTPMIDIVFQLLTFFILVSNFENIKADERVKLPEQPNSTPPEVAREKELMLNVGFIRDSQGKKLNPNALLFYTGQDTPVLESRPLLQNEKRTYHDMGVDPKDVTVVIRADKEVPTGEIQELIRLCQEPLNNSIGGFQKFALKAMSEQKR